MSQTKHWEEKLLSCLCSLGDGNLTNEKIAEHYQTILGHRTAYEEEVFLGREELADLLAEVIRHRLGMCPSCKAEHVERHEVWGYDG